MNLDILYEISRNSNVYGRHKLLFLDTQTYDLMEDQKWLQYIKEAYSYRNQLGTEFKALNLLLKSFTELTR